MWAMNYSITSEHTEIKKTFYTIYTRIHKGTSVVCGWNLSSLPLKELKEIGIFSTIINTTHLQSAQTGICTVLLLLTMHAPYINNNKLNNIYNSSE